MAPDLQRNLALRALSAEDFDEVVRIDALHTEVSKPGYWRRIFDVYLGDRPGRAGGTVALGVDRATGDGPGLAGYLFGDIRAVEFGSEPCGWIFAVGVDPQELRQGVARALLDRAKVAFGKLGVHIVRTMVRRNDVPVLSFFRAGGFVGGAFTQLEFELDSSQPDQPQPDQPPPQEERS